ncbi:hypothetical protein Tco_1191480 [Tanacetum coccineum]
MKTSAQKQLLILVHHYNSFLFLKLAVHFLDFFFDDRLQNFRRRKASTSGSEAAPLHLRIFDFKVVRLFAPECFGKLNGSGDSRKSLACIRLCHRGQSCLHTPSNGHGSDICDIRSTNSDGDNAAPCLLKGLATPCFRRQGAALSPSELVH